MNPFALVTPAHNEARFIPSTITSVLAQDHRPSLWIIVNDASTDDTRGIVQAAAREHPFIKLLNITRKESRGFDKKANAFNYGVASLNIRDFAYIGNLDADIQLKPNYFRNLAEALNRTTNLGLTGGAVYTTTPNGFKCFDENPNSVAGAVQFFRRECFLDIGAAYTPYPYGGIDTAAEVTARYKGWQVRKLPSEHAYELRATGSASAPPLRASFRSGCRSHSMGYHPLFFTLRLLYRLTEPPAIVGSLFAALGYLHCAITKRPILLPPEIVTFLRREQLAYLKLHRP